MELGIKAYFDKTPFIGEFYLYQINEVDVEDCEEEAWEIIKGLYHSILHNDSRWHFFYEGPYNIIRCSKKYIKKVTKYMEANNVRFVYNGKWVDGSKTVEKYKYAYTNMFHSYSSLAISLSSKDITTAADRACHCFFNHIFYVANKEHGTPGTTEYEVNLMSHILNRRADYIGYCNGVKKTKAYMKTS